MVPHMPFTAIHLLPRVDLAEAPSQCGLQQKVEKVVIAVRFVEPDNEGAGNLEQKRFLQDHAVLITFRNKEALADALQGKGFSSGFVLIEFDCSKSPSAEEANLVEVTLVPTGEVTINATG